MDSNNIEGLSVNKIENIFYKTDLIQPFITVNDKMPCWDGVLFCYKSASKTVDNLFGKCDIQVKGKITHSCKDLRQDHLKYQVEVNDLKKYLTSGGILYFVGLIDQNNLDNIEIYYSSLLPYDIMKMLHELKQHDQKTKVLRLKRLPTEVIEVEKIVKRFILNSRLQYSTTPKEPFNAKTFKNLLQEGAKLVIFGDIEDYFRNEHYIYQIMGENIYRPIIKGRVEKIGLNNLPISVKLDGVTLYDKATVQETINTYLIQFGQGIILTLTKDTNQYNINLSYNGEIDEAIKDIEFFRSLAQGALLEVKPIASEGAINPNTLDISLIEKNLHFFKQVKRLFELLHIKEKFCLKGLTNDGYELLSCLVDCIVEQKKLPAKPDITDELKIFGIGSLKIAVIAKVDNHFIQYFDYFNDNLLKIEFEMPDGSKFDSSIYTELTKEHFLQLSNIDYEAILRSVKKYHHEEHAVRVNNMLLHMLNAYDECKNMILLDAALEIAKWLKEKYNNEFYVINYYQTLKRKRDFSKDEVTDILTLKHTEDKKILAATAKLLGSNVEYEYYLNSLTGEEKLELTEFPISHLP